MAPGKSHKYTQNNNRQEVSQFLVNRPNPRNQNLGQQDLESTNYAQQQNSAPQSHAQKVSRQQNDVNQNTNQQKASAQSSQLQQRKRPQKARQQNHQQPNPLRNDSSSQQHPSQNHQHQAARPRGNQQDFVPKSNEDNHQPNALSEGSDEQNVTALWFQGHQNPAPQSSHQRDSYQGQRCPQKPSQTNHHGSNRRQNAFILPKNPARQSSDHQKPRSISNTHSKDGVQQKREDDMQQTPRLTALQKIRDYTKEWIPNPHHRRQPFVKLPRDLALEIMDHLGPVDKASFALTTKSMWE
ncbi:hypothetical protein EYB26_009483 [Talaromyces marneffei]|nr:uncharacterized protein EYB26_009483 [Talaromyces marneffei]QGA21772.1 hypothetical protein EYB26_009483 [Talaromyces marneffei]